MRKFLQYHRRMFFLMCALCMAATVGLAFAMRPDMGWAGGFAAGAVAQLFKFGFLDVAAIRKIAAEKEAAASTQLKSMFLSLVAFGLAVVVVYKFRLNVWAMAAGIFLPRIVLLADAWIRPDVFAGTAETDDAGSEKPGINDRAGETAQADSAQAPENGAGEESGVR